ncbi:hypothetical protein GGI07_004006 [Coemansia sp. Benny D115]|nr:hypothetical protein GGI07_004006 [Coemansia sp. Benny D115]
MEHFQIPGKYQKFFTGRLRKRERSRMEKQLETKPREEDSTELKRIAASTITVDESVQRRKVELMRSQILRILERHLASNSLPVKQLSMQYWEVTDVLVSFNLRTAVCCYKVTAKKDKDGVHPYQIRKIIKDSAKYLNLVVNQELEKGISRGMGAPRTVSLRFTNSASTSKLIELMQDQISASENTAGSAGSAGSADGAANKDAGDAEADGGKQ